MQIGTSTVTAIYLGTTSIVSAYLGATQVFGGSFTPLDLFSGGAQGIWLDPSDLSTMFSDRAGTTPVTTPGTVVGLRLDKSKGLVLGSELVTNGDFAAGTTGWLSGSGATLAVTSGQLVVTNPSGGTNRRAYQAFSATVGATYRIQGQMVSGGRIGVGTTVAATETVSVSGSVAQVFTATATTMYIGLSVVSATAGETATFDNISVRELPGNHAVAPTDAARPVYGVEPKGGRRNLLTFSEQFDNAAWVKSNVTVASTQYLAPDGTTTAERMVLDSATSTHFINTPVSSAGVGRHVASYYVKADGANFLQIAFGSASNPNNAFVNYDLSAGSVGTANSATGAIQSLPNGWFRISCVCDFDAAASQHSVVIVQSATSARLPSFAGDGTSGVYIWGAQLELGSTATAYQKVVTAYNVTESGVPTCHYLQYDGSDDSMSTSAIDFTGTDKMSVFAGVRKLSDAARGMVAELSSGSATTGAWNLNAPDGAVANFAFRNVGSLGGGDAVTSSTFTAPTSNVLTAIGDIAADVSQLRVNGSVAATSAVDLGTGNYGNYPLFIGRRNNATLPFNGRDFGIIIVGKAASAGEITDTEAWLAARTSGVSL